MLSVFTSLRKSFDAMEVVCTDSSIRPLSEIFKAVDDAFTKHFADVMSKIVAELNQFLSKQVDDLPAFAHEHQRLMGNLSKAEERFVSKSPQSVPAKLQQREQALTQSHTCSNLSFFEFCTKKDGIDLKLRSLLPRMFLAFLTSVSVPFSDCLAQMNDKSELLNSGETTIQEVDEQLQASSSRTVETKQQLASQIPLFWQRLHDSSASATTQTSIQGYL
jgi:hypothetical protein